MKVLILGATGFIGFPAAQALVRAGHIVYGLTRSHSKSRALAVEEIIPVVGDPLSESWHKLISKVDVVIDAIGGPEISTSGTAILKAVSQLAKSSRPLHAPKLTFIYTSGTWVHGDSRSEIVSDTTPLTKPIPLTSWRVQHEQEVIHNPVVNGIVIRPALLYGRSGSILALLFTKAVEGKISWFGTPGGRYSLIHADDLADMYVRVSEKAQTLGGLIFDAANDITESVDDLLQRLTEISGASEYEYVKPTNVFESAITTTGILRPYLARSLLGWSPKKPGLVDGLETYYNAYLASRDDQITADILKARLQL